MTQSITPHSRRSDESILEGVTLLYGSRLETLCYKQKRALVVYLALRLSSLESLLDLPPNLTTCVGQLTDNAILALLEAAIAQLKTTK
jgi:hypothetical protein